MRIELTWEEKISWLEKNFSAAVRIPVNCGSFHRLDKAGPSSAAKIPKVVSGKFVDQRGSSRSELCAGPYKSYSIITNIIIRKISRILLLIKEDLRTFSRTPKVMSEEQTSQPLTGGKSGEVRASLIVAKVPYGNVLCRIRLTNADPDPTVLAVIYIFVNNHINNDHINNDRINNDHINNNNINNDLINNDHINNDHINNDHINNDHINNDHINNDHINNDHINNDHINNDHINNDHINNDHINNDHINNDHINKDHINKDHINKDHINNDHINNDHINNDHINNDHINNDHINNDHNVLQSNANI
nr:homeobox protein 3-like [Procambarus clarkii]